MNLVLLVGESDARSFEEKLASALPGAFRAAALPCEDWNRDLSPWAAPRAFKKGADFAGGAPAFLPEAEKALKNAEAALGETPAHRIIAGYSLAGLFALWALYQTPLFDCAACASPSLWYPGFGEFMASHAILAPGPRVALSLGDLEEKTRNPVLASVGDGVRAARARLASSGVKCTLRTEAGGHFQDAEDRTVRAVLDLFKPDV